MTMVAGLSGSRVQVQDELQASTHRSAVGSRLQTLAREGGAFTQLLSDGSAVHLNHAQLVQLAAARGTANQSATQVRTAILQRAGYSAAQAGEFQAVLTQATPRRTGGTPNVARPPAPTPASSAPATAPAPQAPGTRASAVTAPRPMTAQSINRWLTTCDSMAGHVRMYIPMSHGRAPIQFNINPTSLQRPTLEGIRSELRAQISQNLNGHALSADPAEDARLLNQLVDSTLAGMHRGYRGNWNDLANASDSQYVVINPVDGRIRVGQIEATTNTFAVPAGAR